MDASDGAIPPPSQESTRAGIGEPVSLKLVGGYKDTGEPVYENILVTHLSPDVVRLAKTPGIVLGIAAGDVIRVDGKGGFTLISRGGNIAVQIYGDPSLARSIESDIEALGGKWDGGLQALTIYTIPASVGFERIEAILNGLVGTSSLEWYYGNVYDLADGVTPLNWWRQ